MKTNYLSIGVGNILFTENMQENVELMKTLDENNKFVLTQKI